MNSGHRLGLGAVTGANGFIGRSLCAALQSSGSPFRGLVRVSTCTGAAPGHVAVGEIGPKTNWVRALAGVDWVVHCAALAHAKPDESANAMARYVCVNAEGTANLAEQAAGAGVRRFVFLSSIGVLGNSTSGRRPFVVTDPAAPGGAYASSKWLAEDALREIADRTGMQVLIVRPPLVYGPGAPGNFARLVRLVARGVPLPFGSVDNRRSLIGIRNLVDMVLHCISSDYVQTGTFHVSDGEDISTPDLVRRIARAMNRPARLLPVPLFALKAAAGLAGRKDDLVRLTGSLEIDIGGTFATLGWRPRYGVDEGILHALRGIGS